MDPTDYNLKIDLLVADSYGVSEILKVNLSFLLLLPIHETLFEIPPSSKEHELSAFDFAKGPLFKEGKIKKVPELRLPRPLQNYDFHLLLKCVDGSLGANIIKKSFESAWNPKDEPLTPIVVTSFRRVALLDFLGVDLTYPLEFKEVGRANKIHEYSLLEKRLSSERSPLKRRLSEERSPPERRLSEERSVSQSSAPLYPPLSITYYMKEGNKPVPSYPYSRSVDILKGSALTLNGTSIDEWVVYPSFAAMLDREIPLSATSYEFEGESLVESCKRWLELAEMFEFSTVIRTLMLENPKMGSFFLISRRDFSLPQDLLDRKIETLKRILFHKSDH